MTNSVGRAYLAFHRPDRLFMSGRNAITGLLSALVMLFSLGSAQAKQTIAELASVTERCVQTVSIAGGYRTFSGAVFQTILDDGVHVSEGEIDVFLRIRTRENRRTTDACSFEAEDVTEREFGLHAASVTQIAEGLGLPRNRPVTETNFTFGGCYEDEVKGPTNLNFTTVYRKKSKVIHFRVESSSGGFSSCGD